MLTLRICTAAALVAGAALAACGGEPPPATGPDAGAGGNARLVVNDPPGELLGLSFGGSETLSVTYVDASGEPIAGGQVGFRMLTSDSESTGGSTLSSNSVITSGDGVAEVGLVAGAERVSFRVEASAADAPSVVFYVEVSEEGFTDLVVTPTHDGFRNPSDLLPVHLRLYRESEYRCADIDFDAIPEARLPERSVDAFGAEAQFPNRSSGEGYTLVAFGDAPEGSPPLSASCVDLGAAQVRPGSSLRISLALADRESALPEQVELTSRFDLALLAAALGEAGATAAWETIEACPAAPGQLVLDCAEAALAGRTDCAPGGDDPLVDALEAQRGAPDEDGCRPYEEEGEVTLDGALTDAIAEGDAPSGQALADLAAARAEILSDVELASRLRLPAPGVAEHRLEEMRLGAGGEVFALDLHATSRTVLAVDGVSLIRSRAGGGQISIGRHGFTARVGSAAAAAFRALALEPAGLGDDADALGQMLAGSARDADSGTEGCAAVSAISCRAAGEPEDCLLTACEAGAAALDARLVEWAALADGVSLDLSLSGAAPVADEDLDLVIDRVARGEGGAPAGSWAATLRLADDAPVDLVGSFGGDLP